jgi:hypothetical protein
VNEVVVEVGASSVIESAHIAGVGRFIITIEMLVNETNLFKKIQHDSC